MTAARDCADLALKLFASTTTGRGPHSWPRSRRAPRGGAAGLQLAALSARTHAGAADGSGDVAGFVGAFSGSHRFVLDYLVEEVLDGQRGKVRAFLLDMCVLDQLTGGVCDALTGRPDSDPMTPERIREIIRSTPLELRAAMAYVSATAKHPK